MLINRVEPIFALATNSQRSALHIHRISGYGIFEKLLPYIFKKSTNTPLTLSNFPHTQYVIIYDENKTIIDDVMVTFYKAPKSFTGEDLIEITCHGNPIISKKFQSFFRYLGFIDAREGEFTHRAFLNGKLDLSQAEAIRELIHAETYAGVQLSRNQLNGDLTQEINLLREKFLDILTYLEAHIDFSTDEVGHYETKPLIPKLDKIIETLEILKNSYVNGIKLKEGLSVVLCGSPNSGKSTLYNTLLNSDRAIVTDIPGTTRDVLTERLVIDNRDFLLMDTAGLRHTKNKVEILGIERSLNALKDADIICALIDGTKSLNHFTREPVLKLKDNNKLIFVISKMDLISDAKMKQIIIKLKKTLKEQTIIFVSQQNIMDLKKILIQKYDAFIEKSNLNNSSSTILISERSHNKVQNSLCILNETRQLLERNDLPEKIASSVYCALQSLEEILGEIDIDHIYENIFSKFCIGK